MNFVITVTGRKISASEYIFFSDENIVRELTHPAEIDIKEKKLVIFRCCMKGHDTGIKVEQLKRQFSALPVWNRTQYFQIMDNSRNEKYFSSANILVMPARNFHRSFSDIMKKGKSVLLPVRK